ncbi:MAG TPA: DinB family protein [Longimicrobium sp.]|nr:DinB family protein [Longimicrobium sp.]
MHDALTFTELMGYTGGETERWHAWFREQDPAVLDVPIGEGSRATVRGLLVHTFAVERRYADRLLGDPVTPYEGLPDRTVDEIFGIFHEGRAKLKRFVETAKPEDWERRMTFQTITAGELSGSARKVVAHAFLHGIRHWAQIATALRQAGHPQPWMHDILMSDALV